MAALDGRASGKMGMRAVVYYTTTTIIAVFIGIIMVLIIHPGRGTKDEFTKHDKIEQVSPADAFLDLIRYHKHHMIFTDLIHLNFCFELILFVFTEICFLPI